MLSIHHMVQNAKLWTQSDVRSESDRMHAPSLLWVEMSVRKMEENGQRSWSVSCRTATMETTALLFYAMSSFLEWGQSWATSPEMATAFDSFQAAELSSISHSWKYSKWEAFSQLRMYPGQTYSLLQLAVLLFWSCINCIKHLALIMAEMKWKDPDTTISQLAAAPGETKICYLKYIIPQCIDSIRVENAHRKNKED